MKKSLLAVLFGLFMFTSCTYFTTKEETCEKKTGMCVVEEERTGDELKIVAAIKVKPECVRDILPVFQAVVTGSQSEEGCISYNLHQDVSDSTKFVMLEEWKSQEAIDIHNNSEHFKAFQAASADMVEGLDISVLKLVY